MKNKLFTAASAVMIVGLMSCASERKVPDLAASEIRSDDPAGQINELEGMIVAARTQEVGLLAPTWFGSAEKSLDQAKRIRAANGDTGRVVREVAEGRAQLKRAKECAASSRHTLAEVLKKRNQAKEARDSIELRSPQWDRLQADFASADRDLREATEAIEDQDMNEVLRRRAVLIPLYSRLEARALTLQDEIDRRKAAVKPGLPDFGPNQEQL